MSVIYSCIKRGIGGLTPLKKQFGVRRIVHNENKQQNSLQYALHYCPAIAFMAIMCLYPKLENIKRQEG